MLKKTAKISAVLEIKKDQIISRINIKLVKIALLRIES